MSKNILVILIVLVCFIFNCGNQLSTGTQNNEVGWTISEDLPTTLYSAVKAIQYSYWSTVPDSECQVELSMKYIRFYYDTCFFYQPTADTSCYYRLGYPLTYRHGLFSASGGIGYVSQKGDTLRIRWTAEYSFDHDIELYYVPCDTIPGPLCNSQGYPL